MYFLSDTPWGDFPTWLQAGCAMITLMLVIMGLLQNKRIQELIDIVSELRNQTAELQNQTSELKSQSETLTKRYDLEKRLSIRNRIPFLEKYDFLNVSLGRYAFVLVNTGTEAVSVQVKSTHSELPISAIEFQNGVDLKRNNTFRFEIFTEPRPFSVGSLCFSLVIEFSDNAGNKFQQNISVVNGIPKIQAPEDIE